jgi:hypothetical protein
MKLDRVVSDYFNCGTELIVKETAEDGEAHLTLRFSQEAVLFQYKPNIQFVFANRKRADGIIFLPDGKGKWNLLLIELKRSIGNSTWELIKKQWHGAWLHAIALAGVLEITLTGRVKVMAGYRQAKLGDENADPILLKSGGAALTANHEWKSGTVPVAELGQVSLHRCQLNEHGLGEFSFP